jgi:benzil reductase ((S)-benzoin forming)
MKHVIITGASRGLGEGIAYAFAQQDVTLYLIARSSLSKIAKKLDRSVNRTQTFKSDLSSITQIDKISDKIFDRILAEYEKAKEKPEFRKNPDFSVYLINNAGTVEPLGPLGKLNPRDIIYHYHLNLLAPIILANRFIKNLQDLPIKRKRILNITSGAASSVYYGWTCYGPSKAALDHFTKIASLEQISRTYPVEITAIAPGVLHTQMQEKIRHISEDDFPAKKRFLDLYEKNLLLNPLEVGLKIGHWLTGDKFNSGEITRIDKI